MLGLLKRPSAYVPLVISAMFLTAFTIGNIQGTLVRQPDEDTGAHLFQILMPTQALIIAFSAISGCRVTEGRRCKCWLYSVALRSRFLR